MAENSKYSLNNDALCTAHVYELDESDDDLKKEDISFGPLGHSESARSISLTPGSLLHGRPRPPSTSQVGYLSVIGSLTPSP